MRGDSDQAEFSELAALMKVRHRKKLTLPGEDSSENEQVHPGSKRQAIEADKEQGDPEDKIEKKEKKEKKRRKKRRRGKRTRK